MPCRNRRTSRRHSTSSSVPRHRSRPTDRGLSHGPAMGRCQRAITSFAILSGRVDHGFAGVMHGLFPPRARQHEESCFRADMFEPAGYESPAIPPVVTSAQSEAIDRWFSVVVKLFRTGRQALLLSVVPRRQRAADSPKSSANAPDCRTPHDVRVDVAPCLVVIGVSALPNALHLQVQEESLHHRFIPTLRRTA